MDFINGNTGTVSAGYTEVAIKVTTSAGMQRRNVATAAEAPAIL